MVALGREAVASMISIEDRQQEITLEKLCIMVEAERSYQRSIVATLEKVHSEMTLIDDTPISLHSEVVPEKENAMPPASNGYSDKDEDQPHSYFLPKVKHSFRAQEESELTLQVDDYVIVRQVSSHGWSEGECNGRGGWFPSAYVEKAEKAPTTEFQSPNHQN